MCAANFNPNIPNPVSYGGNINRTRAKAVLYPTAALLTASMYFPGRKLYQFGKDEFQRNSGKIGKTMANTAKGNVWTLLTLLALGGTAATLASNKSVNSEVPIGKRIQAALGGIGTNVISTITELGAGLSLLTLASIGHNHYKQNGKIGSAIAATLKRNPIGAAAFAGLAAISLWLEVKSAHLSDKAISGKAGNQSPPQQTFTNSSF